MAKEINIPVHVIDAEQAKSKIDSVGRAGKELGGQLESGQTQAAGAVDKTSEKMNILDRVLHRVRGQVLSFVAGWLGLRGVQTLINGLIEGLQRVQQLQQDIYKSSLPLSDLGQKVAAQAGGTQQNRAEQIASLQKTGGLATPEIAAQMMLAANAAYSEQGGMDFLKQISPFIGAEQLSADDAAKLIELAGAARVPATQAGFMDFAAKLQAGAKATKAKTFGEFFTGAQKSLTAYMAAGGTLEKGISLYAAGGESDMENILKLVTGLDKKEQHAVERSTKVDWSKLSTDQRIETFSKYISSLPPQHRERILKRGGFPAGTAELFGGLMSPQALAGKAEVEKQLAEITAGDMQKKGEIFTGTESFKAKQIEAEAAEQKKKAAPEFAPWQQRFERIKTTFDILVAQGKDKLLIRDAVEPYVMAFGEMMTELDALKTQLPASAQPAIAKFRKNIFERSKSLAFLAIAKPDLAAGLAGKAGSRYERLLRELRAGTVNENELENPTAEKYFNKAIDITAHPKETALSILKEVRHRMTEARMPNLMPPMIYNDHSLIFNPVVGNKADRLIGPRADRESGR